MEYKVVTLEEKTVIGISARTSNFDPKMSETIGGLWTRFFEDGMYSEIEGKMNGKALGIYTDYEDNEKNEYTALVACEVKEGANVPEGMVKRKLAAGRYAEFVVIGDMVKAVQEFWEKLWTMDLPRSFVNDFEEYQDEKMEDAEIRFYISLRD